MAKIIEDGLNRLYLLCGYLAAGFIVLILVLVGVNIFDRLTGSYTAGTNELAGYFLAAAGALGMAYTFGENGHIKVTLLVERLEGNIKGRVETLGLLVAAGFSCFLSYYLVKMVFDSWRFGEISSGTDELPLWIPQMPMVAGFVVFSISLVHAIVRGATAKGARSEIISSSDRNKA